MAEKILSRKVGRPVTPGEFIVTTVDLAYAHDGTAPPAIKLMEEVPELSGIANPDRVVLVIDHASPPPTVPAATVHLKMRMFAKKHRLRLFDVGTGICHQAIPESGLVKPWMLVLGADSHTVTLGAFGAFATGVGSTDIAVAMSLGKAWLRVPESFKVVIEGTPPPWIMGKDVILSLIGEVGAAGLTYMAAEFMGEGIKHLSMDSRMTVSNMTVEAGAKAGIFPSDAVTKAWYAKEFGEDVKSLEPDPGAEYSDETTISLEKLEPMMAAPPNVDNVAPVTEFEGEEVNQVFIGSCTNGRYEDFVAAARILKGRRVAEGVRCVAIPASRKVFTRLLKEGIIEILVSAGCVVTHSTCGPCIGAHMGLLAEGETAVSTSNRNFIGRMGHAKSRVYLTSPLTAAVTAVEGKIADPRKYIS